MESGGKPAGMMLVSIESSKFCILPTRSKKSGFNVTVRNVANMNDPDRY
jgi:hypothetical protein